MMRRAVCGHTSATPITTWATFFRRFYGLFILYTHKKLNSYFYRTKKKRKKEELET